MSPRPPLSLGPIALLGLGLALTPMVVGLPMVAVGAGTILAWAHGYPDTHARCATAGWTAVLVLGAAVITGLVFGVAIVDLLELATGDDDVAIPLTGILAPLVAGLMFAPLAFIPSLALADSKAAWPIHAVWLAAHLGALRVAGLGLLLGAHGALPFALAWPTAVLIDDELALLALPVGAVLTVLLAPFTLKLVVRSFQKARDAVGDPERAVRALGALGRLALIPIGIVILAIGIAASAPLPLRVVPRAPGGSPLPLRIEGTDLVVDHSYLAIHVRHETAGVRSGEDARFPMTAWMYEPSADVTPLAPGEDGAPRAYRIVVSDEGGDSAEMVIDPRGRRLDDGIAARLDARLPASALLLLALAAALGVIFVVRIGRMIAKVRTLGAVLAGDRRGGDVVTGTLRLAGAPVKIARGRLHASGGATLEAEGGALRIALPDQPVEILAREGGIGDELADGTPLLSISRGARLGGVSLRDAAARWPAGGALVIGDPERARLALVRGSFPWLVRIGLALGGALFAAALAISASG